MNLINKTTNTEIIQNVIEAKTFFQRSRGLMFRSNWNQDAALWIHRCNSIHTAFVQFPIDVVFVDKNLIVKKIINKIKPWRLILPIWRSSSVFEFTSDSVHTEKINIGDQLYVGT